MCVISSYLPSLCFKNMLYDEYLHQIRQQQERAGHCRADTRPALMGNVSVQAGPHQPLLGNRGYAAAKKESSFKIDFQSTEDKFPKIFSVRQRGHETVNNKVFFHLPLEP